MKLAAALVIVAAGASATGCSQHLYSPPTQAYSLAPVTTLGPNDKALDIDGSTHSQIFDPGIETGTGRLRAGIGNDAEISVEGTAARVNDSGPSTANRDFYTGRAGVRVDPGRGPISWNAGIGGGFSPSAGTFAAIDGGVSIGYDNCYVVPIVAASMLVSQPLVARAVDVTVDSDHAPMYSTPERTAGGTVRGGLRISLSPDTCHAGHQAPWITAGFDMTTLVDATSHAELFGAGVGLTLPL
ncbi:MAG TPA: hypothetical protein VF403_17725 [Kofleriaceae bacterium]